MNADEHHQQQLEHEEMEMGIIAKGSNDDFEPAPEGTHVAVCTMMVDLGMQTSVWDGIEKAQHKVYLGFSLVNEPLTYERDGETVNTFMAIGQQYTLSLHEKAKLRQHLEAWRGRRFTDAELEGFDITAVLGAPCMVSVVHNQSNGKTYANIAGISSLVKGMEKPTYTGELIVYHEGKRDQADKLPRWIRRKLGLESDAPINVHGQAQHQSDDQPFNDDLDIPF